MPMPPAIPTGWIRPPLPYTGLGPRRLYMRCSVWPGPRGLVPAGSRWLRLLQFKLPPLRLHKQRREWFAASSSSSSDVNDLSPTSYDSNSHRSNGPGSHRGKFSGGLHRVDSIS